MGGSAPAVTSMSGPRCYGYERAEAASDPHSAARARSIPEQKNNLIASMKKKGGGGGCS